VEIVQLVQQLGQVVSTPSSSAFVTTQFVLLLQSFVYICTNSTIASGCNNLHKTCMQAPVSVGDRYNGTLDMSYDSNHASRGWDSSSLVSAPVSGAMPLEHATLVQQPLPDDDNRAVEN